MQRPEDVVNIPQMPFTLCFEAGSLFSMGSVSLVLSQQASSVKMLAGQGTACVTSL